MMRIRVTYAKDGTSRHEVLERSEGENCTLVYAVTDRLGPKIADEITGPDCDPNFGLNHDNQSLPGGRYV
jgi:hypothetical protein